MLVQNNNGKMLGEEVCQTERCNGHFSYNHYWWKTQSMFESHGPSHFQHDVCNIVVKLLLHLAPLVSVSKIGLRRLARPDALPVGVMFPVKSRMNGWIALLELILVLASVRSINLKKRICWSSLSN